MNVYIETLGCPKNFVDSESAAGILSAAGHNITDNIADAQAVLVNTCGFINDAKKESIDKIFELAGARNSGALLIVSGCLSQRYGNLIFKQMPEVDVFMGVNDYASLPDIIENFNGKREKYFSPCGDAYTETPQRRFRDGDYSAALKIAEGCDNVCAYCVIPSIRGGYRSRKRENIIREADMLAGKGCKELIIVAQDVTAYGTDIYDDYGLPELLKDLCRTDGIRWIRLMYCYEDRITDELIETMRSEEKICKYIDIPLQHCNDSILRAMGRRSVKSGIIATVGKLRRAMPDIHIRTTFITGFPGEGRAEFLELMNFIESMKFERLGVFTYSKEAGTPAAKMKNQVRASVKKARLDAIMLRQLEISLENNAAKIGKTFEILVEGMDEEGAYIGRGRFDAPDIDNSVIFTSRKSLAAGDMVNVEITDAFDYDLVGREV